MPRMRNRTSPISMSYFFRTEGDGEGPSSKHTSVLQHNPPNRGPSVRRYRGVYHESKKGLWRARIYWRGTHTTIGRYPTAEAAARAHDSAAVYVFGPELAVTNFLARRSTCEASQFAACFGDNVRARLLALRNMIRQGDGDSFVLEERAAKARRFAAASTALNWPGQHGRSRAMLRHTLHIRSLQALVLVAAKSRSA
jgi:hypothetical protein